MTKKPRITAGKTDGKPRKAAPKAQRGARGAKAAQSPAVGSEAAHGPGSRTGTKQAELIAMLRKPDGATIAEIMAATNWQSHTVRGAIAGALKKKRGLKVNSEKVEGRGRVYRITD